MSNRGNRGSGRPGEQSHGRRPLFHIGPGLIVAVIVAVVMGGSAIKKEIALRERSSAPIVERSPIGTDQDRLGPTPEIGFLIERQEALKLSNTQLNSLTKLNLEWNKFYTPRMRQAKAAESRVRRYLADSQGSRSAPVPQIQEQAEPLVALSAEISRTRTQYWNRATELLTPEQKKAVDRARAADYDAKLQALAEKLRNSGK